ncbi:DUF2089 domain-containing protein [Halothermothrix orenii]|uniref:Uncharacterized consrved protein, containing Zn finger n=1 Tax=Halothermothrix orenii (strain H 168 / OCM 544 / DSM 9562) TaxID=373903 RepID=B8CVX5_HALOH|nr:DUF2089 domain-containing protein [Halothermothrix orenii]ACL69444.1 uncharacterized consrved protein, containing Zn finger [Halothermothrix orenii H 168]
MANKIIGKCPVCGDQMRVVSLKCPQCQTVINGNFRLNKFSRLDPDQLHFVEVFIKCRGNIKEVERELGISYPTVRNKLDNVIQDLGYDIKDSSEEETTRKRKEILDSLEKGEISAKEAIELLQKG